MKLFTKSRDDLYQAQALFDGKTVTVLAGSRINMKNNPGFKPSESIKRIRDNRTTVTNEGIVLKDVVFNTLSASATFVTGRVANGMMVWKTDDGKYVRHSLKKD